MVWSTRLAGWSVGRLVSWPIGRLADWSIGRYTLGAAPLLHMAQIIFKPFLRTRIWPLHHLCRFSPFATFLPAGLINSVFCIVTTQVCSRLFVVYLIFNYLPQNNKWIFSCLIAWAIIDIIRYLFYSLNLLNIHINLLASLRNKRMCHGCLCVALRPSHQTLSVRSFLPPKKGASPPSLHNYTYTPPFSPLHCGSAPNIISNRNNLRSCVHHRESQEHPLHTLPQGLPLRYAQ